MDEKEADWPVPCSAIVVDSVVRAATAGLIWGSCSGPREAERHGLKSIARASFMAKSVGKYGFQWGIFAAIFSITRCEVQKFRKQEDWINVLAAGAVAGAAVFGARTHNWKQIAGASGLVCALCHVVDNSRSV